jgi:hypothetical protein
VSDKEKYRQAILSVVRDRFVRPSELICILTCHCHDHRLEPVGVQAWFWTMVNTGELVIGDDAVVTA